MKSYSSHITYRCEVCSFESTNEEEMIAHVARHIGLTPDEYHAYKKLLANQESAGTACSITKNKKTESKFDAAIEAVINFEKTHNLTPEILERGDIHK